MPVVATREVVVVDDLEPSGVRGDKSPDNAPIGGIVNIVDDGGGWEEGRLEARLLDLGTP
jgi:hypothetical protein